MPGRALLNAHIHTMTDPGARAEAIAWDGQGRILAVGADDLVRAAAQEHDLPVEDAGGRVVLPGFVDAHMHFLHVGVRELRPDLRHAQSLAQAFDQTRAWMAANPGDGPVIAEGWDETDWPERRRPTLDELDALAGDRPLVFRRIDGHIAVANSAALALVGDRWGPDLVDHDTGTLLEDASLYLNEVIPVPPEDLDHALRIATEAAHRCGVTAVGEYTQAPFRHAYLRAAEEDTLRMRVANHIYVQMLEEQVSAGFRTGQQRSPWLRDGGLKVFLDGSFGGRTAYMRTPYEDHDGREAHHGVPIWSDEELDRWFRTAHDAGIQITAHAIGDAAIDQGLDAFERLRDHAEAAGGWEGNSLRHRFEHYELPQDDALARTIEMGLVACCQPNFVGAWSAMGGMYERRLGPVFLLNNRYRTFLERGLRLCFGSDGMPFGPLYGIQSAIDHPVPEERITAEEAVWLYTARAAWACHWEDAVGTLETGKQADLLVLDVDKLDAWAPKDWVIVETILGGLTVHRGTVPVPAV